MAYRCPVCDNPETDAEHLANHLAFTAVIRGNGHEDWLDEHVPGWGEENPETLAPKVAQAVPAVDVPEFDDDEGGHDHGARLEDELAKQGSHRGPGAAGAGGGADAAAGGRGDRSEEAAGVMQEARELTEAMYGLDDDGDDADAESADADADAESTDESADADSEGVGSESE